MTAQDYRLKIGTVTVAALAGDSGSLVKNWTTTLTSGGWLVATNDLVYPYAERVQALSGAFKAVGLPSTTWRIARMSDAMWTTLLAVLTGETTAVTIYTYNRLKSGGAGWQTFNCLAHRPDLRTVRTFSSMWYVDVPILFTNMTVAAAS